MHLAWGGLRGRGPGVSGKPLCFLPVLALALQALVSVCPSFPPRSRT